MNTLMAIHRRHFTLLVSLVIGMGAGQTTAAQEYDILIRGARLMDGTGNPWRYDAPHPISWHRE